MPDPPRVRLAFARNAGPTAAKPQGAPSLVAPDAALIKEEAVKKLRLKKKEAAAARLFLWTRDGRAGTELPQEGNMADLLHNDDLIAVSFGEKYQGPLKPSSAPSAHDDAAAAATSAASEPGAIEAPPQIAGSDDTGRAYSCLQELWADQAANRAAYYSANDAFWEADGYGGASDEEAMIGDGGSEEDVLHSLRFIDALRGRVPELQLRAALDVGAGVGRVTKNVLLRRCERVCLLESDSRWLRQARRYLGNKRQQRCSFVHSRCEEYAPAIAERHDVIWIQWTLQYLVDADAVSTLRALAQNALTPKGLLVIKENRPCPHTGSGATSEDAFRVDLPSGTHARYDVTRPDAHHVWLFRCAGLEVEFSEQCLQGEVTAWALKPLRGSVLPRRALVGITCAVPTAASAAEPSGGSHGDSAAAADAAAAAGSSARAPATLLQPSLDVSAQTASPPPPPAEPPLGLGSHIRIGDAYQARLPALGEPSAERGDELVCLDASSIASPSGGAQGGSRAAAAAFEEEQERLRLERLALTDVADAEQGGLHGAYVDVA